MSSDRKERVIHTRVPEHLEAELKDRAAEMGVSVSNLVRNVLEHALGLVEGVVADTEQIIASARRVVGVGAGRPGAAPAEAAPVVVAWQPVVLEKNAVCVECNEILPRGSDAAIGVPDVRAILCTRCLEERKHGRAR